MADIPQHTGDRQALAELELADQARYRAMLDGDLAALDRLLHDGLSYTHSSALQEGKAAYLESIRSGRVRYLDAQVQEVSCQLHGDVALMQGKALLRAIVDGAERMLDNRFLSVWKREDGNWRMLAWASTPIPKRA